MKPETAPCEIINDVNGNVINFYKVLKTRFPELKKKIELTLHSREEYKKAMIIYNSPRLFDDQPVIRARALYTACNMGYLHRAGSRGFDKEKAATVFKNKVERFGEELSLRLRNTQIECNEAHKIIQSRDSEDSFFYCDPPYTSDLGVKVHQGHYEGYTHQHLERDLTVLSQIKGKFLLSNYPSQLLMDFAKKYGRYVKTFDKSLSAAHKSRNPNSNKRKTEVLVANYPI